MPVALPVLLFAQVSSLAEPEAPGKRMNEKCESRAGDSPYFRISHFDFYALLLSMICCIIALGRAPWIRSTGWPPLKMISVGIASI